MGQYWFELGQLFSTLISFNQIPRFWRIYRRFHEIEVQRKTAFYERTQSIKSDAYSRQETIRSTCSDLCDTKHLAVTMILWLIGDKIQKVTTPQYAYQKSYAICRSSFIRFIKTNLVVFGSARLLYSFKRNVCFQLITFQPKTCIWCV